MRDRMVSFKLCTEYKLLTTLLEVRSRRVDEAIRFGPTGGRRPADGASDTALLVTQPMALGALERVESVGDGDNLPALVDPRIISPGHRKKEII